MALNTLHEINGKQARWFAICQAKKPKHTPAQILDGEVAVLGAIGFGECFADQINTVLAHRRLSNFSIEHVETPKGVFIHVAFAGTLQSPVCRHGSHRTGRIQPCTPEKKQVLNCELIHLSLKLENHTLTPNLLVIKKDTIVVETLLELLVVE